MKLVTLFLLFRFASAYHYDDAESGGGPCENDADCLHDGRCFTYPQELASIDTSVDNVNNITNFETNDTDASANGYCSCPSSYVGLKCDFYCPLKCLNGGSCGFSKQSPFYQDNGMLRSTYECRCKDGYKGVMCQIPYVQCKDGKVQCANGSTCSDSDRSPDELSNPCNCNKGFEGLTCETVIFNENKIGRTKYSPEKKSGDRKGTVAIVFLLAAAAALVAVTSTTLVIRRRQIKENRMVPRSASTTALNEGNMENGGAPDQITAAVAARMDDEDIGLSIF